MRGLPTSDFPEEKRGPETAMPKKSEKEKISGWAVLDRFATEKISYDKERFERDLDMHGLPTSDYPEEKRGPETTMPKKSQKEKISVWAVLERAALTAPLPLEPVAGRRTGPHELLRASFVDPDLCEASQASALLEHRKGRCKIQRSFVTPRILWARERESPGADVSVLEDACRKQKKRRVRFWSRSKYHTRSGDAWWKASVALCSTERRGCPST